MTRCKRLRSHVVLAGVLPLLSLVCAAPARAQGDDQAANEAAARSLFNDGRKLLKGGEYAEACPKLEAASKLFQSAGIFLNLGDCHEKLGRMASAWTEFGDAAALAERTNRTTEAREARRRQAALEPKLAHLTINVSNAVPGMIVRRDGAEIDTAAWGAAIPVDPGEHEIRVEASGYEPWTVTVIVKLPRQTVPVEVPELKPVPPPPPAPAPEVAAAAASTGPPPAGEAPPPSRGSVVVDWTLVGAGAVLAIGGGILMQVEAGRASDSRANYDDGEFNSTKTPWAIGLTGVIAGGAAAATGVILLATRHHEAPPATGLRATPWVASRSGGFQLGGSW
jgi:hypothetical protein